MNSTTALILLAVAVVGGLLIWKMQQPPPPPPNPWDRIGGGIGSLISGIGALATQEQAS